MYDGADSSHGGDQGELSNKNSVVKKGLGSGVVVQHHNPKPETRVQFETFDSSMDERRDEKMIFKYIQRCEVDELR